MWAYRKDPIELAEYRRGRFLYPQTLGEPTIDHNGIPRRWVITLCRAVLRRGEVVFRPVFPSSKYVEGYLNQGLDPIRYCLLFPGVMGIVNELQ